jgi:hypothetical protein
MDGFILLMLLLSEMYLQYKRNWSVKGSHQRYMLSTWRLIIGWSSVFLAIICAAFNLSNGNTFIGIMQLIIFFFNLIHEMFESNKDEDNWFNGRGKKIWNNIKATLTAPQVASARI